jgi:hypothetical protein
MLKMHLLTHSGKIACASNVMGRRGRLSTVAYPRAEFDVLPHDVKCARCVASREPKPKSSPKKDTYLAPVQGESFGDYLARKKALGL